MADINKHWYKEMAVYQVWPRSFKDGNGDGIGDLKGVMEKLDYIKSLGVDAIWFSPLYKSPQHDYGYDIADYRDINPEYGTLDEFKELLAAAHERGLKIIMDLVINHTSDEHEWFKESKRAVITRITTTISGARAGSPAARNRPTTGCPPLPAPAGNMIKTSTSGICTFSARSSPTSIWITPRYARK